MDAKTNKPAELAAIAGGLTCAPSFAWDLREDFAEAVASLHAGVRPVSALRTVLPLEISGGVKSTDKPYVQVGSVAVFALAGVLDTSVADVTWKSERWGTGYDEVIAFAEAALADSSVSAAVVVIDSPGGNAMTIEPAAMALAKLTAVKPTFGINVQLMASAALGLGTQLGTLYTGPGAWNGSIGTIMLTAEFSRALDREGITVNTIKSTESKDVGSRYRPMSEKDRAMLQAEVNQYAAMFKARVARGRGVSADQVEQWVNARGYVGQSAVDAGLVDGVRYSIAEVIAEAASAKAPRVRGMKGQSKAVAAVAATAQGNDGNAGASAAGTTQEGTSMNLRMMTVAAGLAMAAAHLKPESEGGGGGAGTAAAAGPAPGGKADGAQAGGEVLAKISDGQVLAAEATGAEKERSRILAITVKAATFAKNPAVQALATQAIKDGWSASTFAEKALDAVGEAMKPTSHVPGGGSADIKVGADRRRDGLSMALLARIAGNDLQIAAGSSDRAGTMAQALGFSDAAAARAAVAQFNASGMRSRTLRDLCFAALEAKGLMSGDDLYSAFSVPNKFMAALSASDFPILLANVANKRLQAVMMAQDTVWDKICGTDQTGDYKDITMVSLSGAGDMEEIPETMRPSFMSWNERSESARVRSFGRRWALTYRMIRDDDTGAFNRVLTTVADMNARLPETIFIKALQQNSGAGPTMADGQALYLAGRGNLRTGSALSYDAARLDTQEFEKQKGFGDAAEPIAVAPRFLLVPTDLKNTAMDIATQEYAPGTAGQQNQTNTLRGRFTALSTPRLSGTKRYWFADPAVRPVFIMYFLDGQRTPVVTQDNDGDPLNMSYQVTHLGVGIGAVDPEYTAMNPGQ